MNQTSEPLARIDPSPVRQGVSTILLFGLAVTLLYLALIEPPQGLSAQIPLLAMGAGALWLSVNSLRSRGLGLVLTQEGLFDTSGRVLARVEDMATVDRGALAFKPTNGFVLHLKKPAPLSWAPGLYWRIGTRIGVGGTTNPAQSRDLSDKLGFLLQGAI